MTRIVIVRTRSWNLCPHGRFKTTYTIVTYLASSFFTRAFQKLEVKFTFFKWSSVLQPDRALAPFPHYFGSWRTFLRQVRQGFRTPSYISPKLREQCAKFYILPPEIALNALQFSHFLGENPHTPH